MSVAPIESPIPLVKGTADHLPGSFKSLVALQGLLIDCFERAGYDRMNTPILEPVELHERKSGAGIVAKLFELAGQSTGRVCLRPELTAGIVRAYAAAETCPPLPWRVSHAGPAFRHESSSRSDRLREFNQVGVERLGDSGPVADAEVIWLASWALAEAGVKGATIRLGHVGLILEILARSGLPPTAQAALVEMLSEAAAEGKDVDSIDRGLDHFEGWLRQVAAFEEIPIEVAADDGGIDRLFRTLVPVVNGRRSGAEIIRRLRRKWDLGQGLLDTLGRVREQVHALSALEGPAFEVLDRLGTDFQALAPDSVHAIRSLVESLIDHGVDRDRMTIDLGFGRGIGFYSRMVFEILAPTPDGPVEVCGGGRYDGLARVLGSDRDDRGVGFAFGLERLQAALSAQGTILTQSRPVPSILVAPESSQAMPVAIRLANRLRNEDIRAILEGGWDRSDLALRAQALGASMTVVVGVDSRSEPSLVLHDHARSTSVRTIADDLIRSLKADREEPLS